MKGIRTMPFVFLLLLIVGLAGCDSSGIDIDSTVRTELRVRASFFEAAKTAAQVEIEEAKLLIQTVQFSAEDGEDYTFNTASFVVDLDLTGRASKVLVGAVPPGAWERLTFKIHKPEDDEAVPDPDFKVVVFEDRLECGTAKQSGRVANPVVRGSPAFFVGCQGVLTFARKTRPKMPFKINVNTPYPWSSHAGGFTDY